MAKAVYQDSSRKVSERVEDLLSRMTVEEKIGQMCQAPADKPGAEDALAKGFGSFLTVYGEKAAKLQETALKSRLGIPLIFGIDAIHGHNFYFGATVFPTQLGLSSSWNPALMETVGRVTAKEMAVTGVHWTFSPVLCIARDLRWGRIDETFGEDAYLIGELACGMIRGYQGHSWSDENAVLACAKHYAGYSEGEGARDASEAWHTERRMRLTFLPAFEAAARGACATFMVAYEAIDGTPCSANPWLLKTVLRDEWGFRGFAVTDWNNVGYMVSLQHTAATIADAAKIAIEAGNDMIMNTAAFFEAGVALVKEGKVDVALVDEAVRRILTFKFELGLFDGKRRGDKSKEREVIATQEHRAASLEAAYQSIVLLTNRDSALPIGKAPKRIAAIGPNADDVKAQLGDWVHNDGQPRENVVTILDGIRKRAGKGCEVVYARGCDTIDPSTEGIAEAADAAAKADVAIVVVGDTVAYTGEGRDRANLDLSGGQQRLVEAVRAAAKKMVVVLVNSKPLSIPWLVEHADAIIEAWNPGMEGGTAVAGIIFGDRAPSGKLTISFPYHVGQQPVYYNQMPGWHSNAKYVDMPKEPLFAFGYGLSYTTFAYSNLRVADARLKSGQPLCVSVDVTNTGKRAGTEIAQLYVQDLVTSATMPVKELKGFERFDLAAGEKRTLSYEVPYDRLAIVDRDAKRVVEPGEFEVMVGGSSRDEDLLKVKFEVAG